MEDAYFSVSGIFTSASDRVSTSSGAVAPLLSTLCQRVIQK